MATKFWNWRLWVGFALSLVALLGYAFVVLETGALAAFWPSLFFMVVAAALVLSGLRRGIREPQTYRGKIAGPILTVLSLAVFGLFGLASHEVFKAIPAAKNAPKVGQRAPEFALVDVNGKDFSLAQLLATPIADSAGIARPPKGVLVFFYRGYW